MAGKGGTIAAQPDSWHIKQRTLGGLGDVSVLDGHDYVESSLVRAGVIVAIDRPEHVRLKRVSTLASNFLIRAFIREYTR